MPVVIERFRKVADVHSRGRDENPANSPEIVHGSSLKFGQRRIIEGPRASCSRQFVADGKKMRTRVRTDLMAIGKKNCRLSEKKRRRVDGMVDMRCLERRGDSRAGSIPVPGTIKKESPSDPKERMSGGVLFFPELR